MTATTTATKAKTQFNPGDRIIVDRPTPTNQSLKDKRLEVIRCDGDRIYVYQNSARLDWEHINDPDHPIQRRPYWSLGLDEASVYQVNQTPSPSYCFAPGAPVVEDLNTENTNLSSLRRYAILADYRDFPNMGSSYPPQPWLRYEDGTEGFAAEGSLLPADRPVVLPAPAAAEPEPVADESADAIATTAVEVVATDPTARLTELEADIEQGLGLVQQGIKTIWAAATAIREERLWQLTGHDSYVAYCKDRWGWGKATAHEHAVAGGVLNTLLLSGVPDAEIPESTRALMELSKVEPEQRSTVLADAAASNGGRATAKAIKAVQAPPPSDMIDDIAEEMAEIDLTGDPETILAEAGLICRPDTSPAAIKLGLESGYLRPTTEHTPSPAASAHAAASEGENGQLSTKATATALGAPEGRYAVGTRGTLGDSPRTFVVARHMGDVLELWDAHGARFVPEGEFSPSPVQRPDELTGMAKLRLSNLIAALGAEQVQALLGEVAK